MAAGGAVVPGARPCRGFRLAPREAARIRGEHAMTTGISRRGLMAAASAATPALGLALGLGPTGGSIPALRSPAAH